MVFGGRSAFQLWMPRCTCLLLINLPTDLGNPSLILAFNVVELGVSPLLWCVFCTALGQIEQFYVARLSFTPLSIPACTN